MEIVVMTISHIVYNCFRCIHEETDIKVLLTGEVSDELFRYKYSTFFY